VQRTVPATMVRGRCAMQGKRLARAMLVVTVAVVASGSIRGASAQCPPEGFDAMENFNFTAWIEHTWFVQEMMPTSFLTEDKFYCVESFLEPMSEDEVKVQNRVRLGSVTGELKGGELSLMATIPDMEDKAKLLVGPEALLDFLYGPYWVLFAGPSEDNYEYGIVSGGPPMLQGPNGCISGTMDNAVNGAGLWLFTKDPVVDKEMVAMLRSEAEGMGFDLSVLRPVEQEGCIYTQ